MSEGMRPNLLFTPAEYAAAAFSDQPDERFSWGQLKKNAPYVRPFVEYVAEHQDRMVRSALQRATTFLDVVVSAEDVPVRLVCGGQWDAYMLLFERSEIYFDVGLIANGPLAQVLPDFESLLAHELWHVAFTEHQKRHWSKGYRKSPEPALRFLYEMLNEGMGHYYSMSRKLPPALSVDLTNKEQKVFGLLRQRYQRWRDDPDEKRREDGLWHSHAGVPFWTNGVRFPPLS
jgi:hypothetical protein